MSAASPASGSAAAPGSHRLHAVAGRGEGGGGGVTGRRSSESREPAPDPGRSVCARALGWGRDQVAVEQEGP